MICPKHGMTMLTYCEACRIEKLVGENEELQRQLNESPEAMTIRFLAADLRANELQAKLDAVEQLPALWKRRMARPWQPCAQPDRFISDLTEALQEQEDE